MKVRLTLFLLCFSLNCFGQKSDKVFRLSISPFSVLDIYNGPNFSLGGEFNLGKKRSNFLALGIGFEGIESMTNNNWQGHKGFYVVEEIRTYLDIEPDASLNHELIYWGIEASFGTQNYTREDSVDDGNGYQMKKYTNHRSFAGLAINIGSTFPFSSGVFLSFNFGIGLRFNQLKNNLNDAESESRVLGDYSVPTTWIQQKGNHLIPKFNIGLKIGYCFN